MNGGTRSRALVTAFVAAAFLWTLALGVLPRLHEQIHADASRLEHSCAVTFVASGSYDHVAPPPALPRPIQSNRFATFVALIPQWVQSPFLGARIFEHAPPSYS